MSKEDKQFIDGLLLGGVLIGIVLAVFILYAFYRNPQPLEQLSNQQRALEQESATANNEMATEESEDLINPNEEITNLVFQDELHLILQEKRHPTQDLVYRLLALDTEAHRELLQNMREETDLDLNDLPYCLDSLSGFTNPILTIWDTSGERLQIFEDNLQNTFSNTICPIVEKWHGDELIVRFAYGDAGVSNNTIYTYALDGSVEKIIDSVTSYLYFEDAQITAWTNGETTFAQKSSQETSGSIYNVSGEVIFDLRDLSEFDVVYETDLAAQVDVASEFNLRNHTKGLEYVIGGERVVLEWNKN